MKVIILMYQIRSKTVIHNSVEEKNRRRLTFEKGRNKSSVENLIYLEDDEVKLQHKHDKFLFSENLTKSVCSLKIIKVVHTSFL